MGGHQNSEYRGDRETSASHRESGVLVCTCTDLLQSGILWNLLQDILFRISIYDHFKSWYVGSTIDGWWCGKYSDKFWSKQKSSWENVQLDLPAISRHQENRRSWGKAESNLKPECEIVRWKSRQMLNTGGQFFDIKIKEMEIGRVLQIGNWRSCFFCNWLFPERRRSYEDYPHFMRRLRTFIEWKAETFYDFRRFL